jgi:hypothetical protein
LLDRRAEAIADFRKAQLIDSADQVSNDMAPPHRAFRNVATRQSGAEPPFRELPYPRRWSAYVLVVLPTKIFLAACLVMFDAVGLRPITFYRTSATTLSATGVGSDNSPTRVMSSMECSVMYFE